MNICFSHSWKKVETLINIYFKFENHMYCISALGRKKTDGRTGNLPIDSIESRFSPATFRGCFFNLILYDFVQSFFHIFVTAVKCSLPFLKLCFILTFSNFHVHFLFGHEKKKTLEIFTDTRLQLSRFTFKNKIIIRLK